LHGGTETILLVEDDAAVRSLTRRMLESFDYCVVEAATGHEAIETWRSRAVEIDLLLTDIVMPDGVTGRELAEMLCVERTGLKTNAFREFRPYPVNVQPLMAKRGMKKTLRGAATTPRHWPRRVFKPLSGSASARSGSLCPSGADASRACRWPTCSPPWSSIS
jgi:hypothetical protein